MRRNDRARSTEEAISLLESAEYGVLSMTCPDGVPHGIPLNFALMGDSIYFHCAPEGKKVDILSANTRVSFCVVGNTQVLPDKFGTKYESAIATGSVEELSAEDKRQGLILLVRKYSPDYMKEGLEYIDKLIAKTKIFRIRLESVTGKART
jgi:nitroimidazol reductase NimA-like FMN-containing flavoprotein (pyridoxamine 5'-phosphate oxidase superfamily)